jgi:hypothetical protein
MDVSLASARCAAPLPLPASEPGLRARVVAATLNGVPRFTQRQAAVPFTSPPSERRPAPAAKIRLSVKDAADNPTKKPSLRLKREGTPTVAEDLLAVPYQHCAAGSVSA